MPRFPRSAYDLTGGLVYFARMCDKIRLEAAGDLPEDYRPFLGKGFDGRICAFFGVAYEGVKARVLEGAADEEVLDWCRENGRGIGDIDVLLWNGFATKRGWRDVDGGSDFLEKAKTDSGFTARPDIQTMFDYYEVDEGRRA